MIKDILSGTKEVIVEVSCGMKEGCESLSSQINTCLDDLNIKMMGSYQELEAYEKAKAEKSTTESEKSA
jgi:hypothetical protein